MAEALTNAAKHAGPSTVVVRAGTNDSAGTLVIESAVGSGTTLLVELPLRAS